MNDSHVEVIAASLYRNKSLKLLNLSQNLIGDQGADHLSYMVTTNQTIRSFILSWNKMTSKGIENLSKGLVLNKSIVILDISFNPIGSQHPKPGLINSLKKFALYFKRDETLIHLDMSHCGFTKEDTLILNKGLKFNHSLLGIHMTGNDAGIDHQGYLGLEPEPCSASHIMSRLTNELEMGVKFHLGSNCWICEGWS